MGKILFVGIDPAPRDAGVSLLIYGEPNIQTENFSTSSLKGCFANWYLRSSLITTQIFELIDSIEDVEKKVVIMEYPPPSGVYAPALYGLDYMILDRIRDSSVVLAHPAVIQHLVGKRTGKKVSKKLSKEIMDENGLYNEKSKYSEHEADATVLLLWGVYNIMKNLKLPENGEYQYSPKRWTWRIKRVDLESILEEKNIKLFDYLGSENAIRK